MANNLASINIRFSADLKGFSTQMQNASRKIKSIGKDMQKVGKNLSVGLTAPIVAFGVSSFAVFANFEDAMAKVKAISGATAKEFKLLQENAEALGSSTRFTASEVANLQLNYSKLGFKPDEILKATEATLQLALATGEDLANSATVAAATLNGFGLEASETQRVVDVMAASFSGSALDLTKFQTAMATLAPVAKNAGVSFEGATGQLAVLTNTGIDASTAGTALRNIYLTLAGSGMTLQEALGQITNSTNKNATAFDLFGKRGATVAAVLADNYKESIIFAEKFRNAGGTAAAMAKIMDNTAKGSMFRLKSAIEAVGISFGRSLAPTITLIGDKIAIIAAKFSNLSAETKKIIVVVAAFAAAIGPLLVVLGLLTTTVIPGVITAFTALKIAMLTNPFTAAVLAIGAVVSALVLMSDNTDKLAQKQTTLQQVTDNAAKSISQERAKLSELLYIAKDENLTKESRIKAIKELNKISPKYLGDLTLEKINTDQATASIEKYNLELLKTARVKAAQQELQRVESSLITLELEGSKKRRDAEAKRLELQKNTSDSHSALINQLNILTGSEKFNELAIKSKTKSLTNERDTILEIITANASLTTSINKVNDAKLAGPVSGPGLPKEELSNIPQLNTFDVMSVGDDLTEIIPVEDFQIFTDAADKLEEKFNKLKETAQIVGSAVSTAFSGMVGRLISSFGLADTGFEGFVKNLAGTIAELISMLLAASIAYAIQSGSSSGASTGPLAVFTSPAFIATAVGGVLAAFSAIPKFAQGGVITGETLAVVGDNRNARFDPEIIAPLSKLRDYMGGNNGTNTNISLGLGTVIKGTDLELVIDRVLTKKLRY